MSLRALTSWLSLGCMLAACSGPRASNGSHSQLLNGAEPLREDRSPAAYRYHPRRPSALHARYDLGAEGVLFVGDGGERWLVDTAGQLATPAATLAPETLVGALPEEPGAGWIFVGASGATYRAPAPLADFVAAHAATLPLVMASAGKRNIAGIAEGGRLVVSVDSGKTYEPVGPGESRFADVVLEAGLGLALELPERLWWSGDDGRTWTPLDAPPFGARAIVRDDARRALVLGTLGSWRVESAKPTPVLSSLAADAAPASLSLGAEPLLGPSADALAEGRAFISDGAYYEVQTGLTTQVIRGRLDEPLGVATPSELTGCTHAKAAGFERWVYVACTKHTTSSTRQYELYRSEDGGVAFEREPYVFRADPERLKLAVGADGELLLSGACPPGALTPSCHTRGVQRRATLTVDAGTELGLELAPIGTIEGDALALSFASDGRRAYVVAQRPKSDDLFVFVSEGGVSEGGASFRARPITMLERIPGPRPNTVEGFGAARDGHLSLVLGHPSGSQALVLLDAEGRTLMVNGPPVSSAAMGAYGTRAVAIAQEEAWESLDGGADWQPIGKLPASICKLGRRRCLGNVVCHEGGCTLSSSLSRIGWGGQRSTGVALPPPPARPPARRSAAAAVGFRCELAAGDWQPLVGVAGPPSAAQAALGRVEWFALGVDDATASAHLWLAHYGGRAQVARSELLAPSPRAADVAYYASLQVEGAAALRYPVVAEQRDAHRRLRDVEVVWENLLTGGGPHRARLADAGPLATGDYSTNRAGMHRAKPDLLSIATGGVYLRPHAAAGHAQTTYYFGGKAVEHVPPLTWTVTDTRGARSEMARVEGQDRPLLLFEGGSRIVRAEPAGEGWSFAAMTVGFEQPERFGLAQAIDIAYFGEHVGFLLTTRHGTSPAEALFHPLQARGPVLGTPSRAPTQARLSEPPRPCRAADRSGSPRIVAPTQPDRRRHVVVQDAVDPARHLVTSGAVLHGSADAPCVAVFDAEPVTTGGTQDRIGERALIGTSPDSRSWLFRIAPDSTPFSAFMEYRAMKCRYDGDLGARSESDG